MINDENYAVEHKQRTNKTLLKGIAIGVAATIALSTIADFLGALGILHIGKQNYIKKSEKIIDLLDKYYVDDIDFANVEDGIYTGLVYGVGDRYTTYLDEESYKLFLDDTSGTFAGIGIYIDIDEKDNGIIVLSPIEGTPSMEAGLLPGDKIIKVDNEDVLGQSSDLVIAKVKGKPGTDVMLTIYRESNNSTFDINITRAIINVPTIKYEMLENNIGYIKIIQFANNTTEQFNDAYNELKLNGMTGLVLDLRNNPGGILDVVCDIADMFLPKGTIMYAVDKNGNRRDELSDAAFEEIPMAVLVNEFSASASEVLSGALKDYDRAQIVGETTFGKGLVQKIQPLGDGTALKITIQKYYTPNGFCVQDVGLEPHHIVKFSEEEQEQFLRGQLALEDDIQFAKALQVLDN